jgi:O-antigen biosynthesis protein
VDRVLFAPRALPPLPPDVAEDPGPYADWVRRREVDRRHAAEGQPDGAVLPLVMAVTGEPPPETVETLHSLQQQTSGQWTLTVVLHDSCDASFTALLAVSGLQRSGQRVRMDLAPDGTPLAGLLARGLSAAAGSDVAFLFPGDVWAPDTVAQLAAALTPDGVVYGDQDSLGADGRHFDPLLKPDYSPDFLLSSSYVGRPLALGSAVATRLPPPVGDTSSEVEHDLALKACELAHRVVHIPEVLCHRLGPLPESTSTDPRPVAAALQRRGEPGDVEPGPVAGTFRIRRGLRNECTASIVIPFRDEPRFLRACVDSIDRTLGAQAMELILIDNGSVQPETATLLDRLSDRSDVRILVDNRPFNWAELNNAGAGVATGEVLVFLNNDIEATRDGWLSALCAQALRPDIGAVGARLLYPDHRLQHCGVVIGLGGAAGHLFVGLEEEKPGYLNMAVLTRECAAVTGACLATRRDVFEELGGFDEALGVDLNDVDYCLRGLLRGWRVLVDASVELIHHESPSRGTAGDVRDIVHFIDRWRDSILSGDPFLNPNLTRVDSSCRLRGPDEKEWWHRWQSTLTRP